ncbi:unnamed protein product [Lymnaea stagnalis]|uniref:ADF-H domain-containing protein n=1 Tax=Lymnaea stagnalis TaxID=6523 RepID=A0AAV2GZ07_LYMST
MSHQTGITANDDLRAFLAQSKDGSVRLIKIAIDNEQLALADSKKPKNSWDSDILFLISIHYDELVVPLLDDKCPCYILYRFDTKNSMGYEWLFIAWSPDFAPVRQKMLYAATRATMKSEFGGGQIKDELFGTVQSDVTLRGYHKHVQAALAPAPLTMAEEELQFIKQNEVNAHINVETKSQTMKGVGFPLTPDAETAVLSFRDGAFNYVQLSLDLEKEVVNLSATDNIHISHLISHVPTESARYHLFNFQHTHEGDSIESIVFLSYQPDDQFFFPVHLFNPEAPVVEFQSMHSLLLLLLLPVFIYSMPGYKCSIRERMLYSSCKNPLVDQLAKLGIEIEKKIEVDDPSELKEEYVYDEIHPKKNVARQAFAKPKGPAGRGPKRMTKPEN